MLHPPFSFSPEEKKSIINQTNSNAGSILTIDSLSLDGRGLALWSKLNYSTG